MIHISLRNKARHTREPGSVVIILMKIPHVRASFDSFHPGKMFVTHFPTENALMPFYLGYKKVEWKKRGGTGGEKKRENRLLVEYRLAPCTTTKTCTTYIHIYIYQFYCKNFKRRFETQRPRDRIKIFICPYKRKTRSQDSTSRNACYSLSLSLPKPFQKCTISNIRSYKSSGINSTTRNHE